MLNGTLVRVRFSKQRVIPLYLKRDDPQWLEVAESLLLIFREGVGRTRGEIETEIDEMLGEGLATLAHRGLAKIVEDRAEFEVVADVPPESLREKIFTEAAAQRKTLRTSGKARAPFRRDAVLEAVAVELGVTPEQVVAAMFADLRDENRLLSVQVQAEVRDEKPARYRQLFRQLKFHRLLYRVEGSMKDGFVFHIDGPLSLFSATNKYGLQMANFLPALLLCRDFRLDAELRWGPKRDSRTFHLESKEGLVSHYADSGTYVPAELGAFVDRFRQVAPAWQVSEATDVLPLGREGVWVPDYKFTHLPTGIEVAVEILGFWKKASLERLLRLLPEHGPSRFLLAISDRLKVDEAALDVLGGPVLRFKEIPNAHEILGFLTRLLEDDCHRSRDA
jgi:predicted nuclease of restriction endonuclease-like RecB superfamily